MKCILLILLINLALVNPSHASEGDWTRFRGPKGSGFASEAKIPINFSESENIDWKIDLPGEGASSPVVWGGAYFSDLFYASGKE